MSTQSKVGIGNEIVDASVYASRVSEDGLIKEAKQSDVKPVPFTESDAGKLESAYKTSRLALQASIVWIIITALVGVISLLCVVFTHH